MEWDKNQFEEYKKYNKVNHKKMKILEMLAEEDNIPLSRKMSKKMKKKEKKAIRRLMEDGDVDLSD